MSKLTQLKAPVVVQLAPPQSQSRTVPKNNYPSTNFNSKFTVIPRVKECNKTQISSWQNDKVETLCSRLDQISTIIGCFSVHIPEDP